MAHAAAHIKKARSEMDQPPDLKALEKARERRRRSRERAERKRKVPADSLESPTYSFPLCVTNECFHAIPLPVIPPPHHHQSVTSPLPNEGDLIRVHYRGLQKSLRHRNHHQTLPVSSSSLSPNTSKNLLQLNDSRSDMIIITTAGPGTININDLSSSLGALSNHVRPETEVLFLSQGCLLMLRWLKWCSPALST